MNWIHEIVVEALFNSCSIHFKKKNCNNIFARCHHVTIVLDMATPVSVHTNTHTCTLATTTTTTTVTATALKMLTATLIITSTSTFAHCKTHSHISHNRIICVRVHVWVCVYISGFNTVANTPKKNRRELYSSMMRERP